MVDAYCANYVVAVAIAVAIPDSIVVVVMGMRNTAAALASLGLAQSGCVSCFDITCTGAAQGRGDLKRMAAVCRLAMATAAAH